MRMPVPKVSTRNKALAKVAILVAKPVFRIVSIVSLATTISIYLETHV
jgi:hypothetical protein